MKSGFINENPFIEFIDNLQVLIDDFIIKPIGRVQAGKIDFGKVIPTFWLVF